MSTLGSTVRALGRGLRDLAASFVAGLLRALLRLTLFAGVVSAGSYVIAARGSVIRGAIAVGFSLLVCLSLVSFVSIRRALLYALVTAAERERIAGRIAAALLDRLIGESSNPNDRSRIARTVERIPLAEATEGLRRVVEEYLGERARSGRIGGVLVRRLERRLLSMIERVALERFRVDAARGSGVDLSLVRDELSRNADRYLVDRVRKPLAALTFVLGATALLASFAIALAIRQLG